MFGLETRAILAALERILYVLLSVLGVAEALGLKLDKTAQESSPLRIQGQVDFIGQQLTQSGTGLSAISTKCDTIIALLGDGVPGVLDAIAALPAGSDLVNPPTSGENADAVWTATLPLSGGLIAGTAAKYAGYYAFRAGSMGGWRQPDNPLFVYRGWLWDYTKPLPDHGWPTGDWEDIQPADTRLTWLTRTEPGYTWALDQYSGLVQAETYQDGTTRFLLTEPQFRAVRDQLAGRPKTLPPVWPGEPNVVEGAPVALGADVTIPGPLDGVRIALTTPPSGLSNFTMGGQTWYYRAGQIAFVSDAGDVETWQYITWTNALYCPRQMYRASSAILRGLAGVEGTATPWLAV